MRVMMALSMGANSNRVSTFTIAVNSSKSERFAVVAIAYGYNSNALHAAPASR
tara:strand:- start:447 stop:605 length:159 start_codon:yes stop_codon:yes gene_type:complete